MTENSERDQLDELVESFVERYRRGERPSVSEYAQAHPKHAERIEKLFPTLVMMEELGPGEGDDSDTFGNASAEELGRLGDYTILREVGRGGMGVVYEAEQEALGRHVALKVLPYNGLMDPTHLKRFQREARAAARLHHTNIVPVFDVGEHEGTHYYAMQFIHGHGLDEVLSELIQMRGNTGRHLATSGAFIETNGRQPANSNSVTGSMSLPRLPGEIAVDGSSSSGMHYYRSVARVGAQTADALAYAHEQGILHRDVKPSNLMVDTEGKVWITDFGLAKTDAKEDLTHTGDLVGTLRYMAPERFDGWSDPRSDIYGLGLTLYEMLTLRPAFDESDRARLIKRITHDELPRPRRKDRNIPMDLETIVLKSIAREPGERYPSADQLAEDLQRFLNNEPIAARRTSVAGRTRMWCRRNPVVAMLTAALALLLFVGIGTAIWAALHFERIASERQQALKAKIELVNQLTAAKSIATQRLEGSGRYHFEHDEYEQAVQDFAALLKADPENREYLWWRSQAYGQLDRLAEAIKDISRYIELNNLSSAEAYRMRAAWQWQTESGLHQLSAQDYRKALEIEPGNAHFLNNLAWHEAMSPPDQRDLDLALECSLQALSTSPKKWAFNITHGIIRYRRGEYDQAIESLEKVRMRNDSFACCFLAMSYHQLGNLSKASHYYRSAGAQWEHLTSRFRFRERILYATEACELIGSHLDEHPDDYELTFRRALLHFRMQNIKASIEDATRMIELQPDLNDGYFWRGRAYMSLRQDELAIQDFEKSLAIRPQDFWCYRNLAWLYTLAPAHLCDLEKAKQALAQAEKRSPGHNLVKEVGALIHYRRNETNKAVQVCRSVSDPRSYGVVQCVLTMCYQKLGRTDDAHKHFKQIGEAWGPITNLDPFWNSVRRSLLAEVEQELRQGDE